MKLTGIIIVINKFHVSVNGGRGGGPDPWRRTSPRVHLNWKMERSARRTLFTYE